MFVIFFLFLQIKNINLKKLFTSILLLAIITFLGTSCARIGSPTGGEKDKQPPKILNITPPNLSTNFKSKRIIIRFDEFIQLKDLNKNLLITPHLKHQPDISPMGTASKEIRIDIKDTLLPNTTYIFNFGESIVDFNEANKYGDFRYVFSTGNAIDSLSLKGKVTPVHFDKKPEKILVGLYKKDDFKDSIIFREPPYYISFTDKSGNFTFNYLSKGDYKVIALLDENHNYVYNRDKEAVGFKNDWINIPKDTLIEVLLFKEIPKFSLDDVKQLSKNHLQITYKGKADSLMIKPISKIEKSAIITQPKKMDYWYKSKEDTLKLDIIYKKHNRKFKKKRSKNIDSLRLIMNKRGLFNPLDTLMLTGNMPLVSVDKNLIKFMADSVSIPFKIHKNNRFNLIFDFDKQTGKNYDLQVLPKAVSDFLGNKNKDTLQVNFKIPNEKKYGNLVLEIPSIKKNYFVEILDNNHRVIQKSKTSKSNKLKFSYLKPGKYFVRIIYDDNKNNKWDTGNYLLHIQPEKSVLIENVIEIRANWDVNQKIELK